MNPLRKRLADISGIISQSIVPLNYTHIRKYVKQIPVDSVAYYYVHIGITGSSPDPGFADSSLAEVESYLQNVQSLAQDILGVASTCGFPN